MALGMTQAAAFYQQRAQAADPTLVTTLGQTTSTPVAATKAPAEAAAPIAPGARNDYE
jgi:hypothetical protein